MKKATETLEIMANNMKSVEVDGRLAYEKFNMLYEFKWISGILVQFNVKPDSATHIIEVDPAVVKEALVAKTKKCLLGLLQTSKLQDAKYAKKQSMNFK